MPRFSFAMHTTPRLNASMLSFTIPSLCPDCFSVPSLWCALLYPRAAMPLRCLAFPHAPTPLPVLSALSHHLSNQSFHSLAMTLLHLTELFLRISWDCEAKAVPFHSFPCYSLANHGSLCYAHAHQLCASLFHSVSSRICTMPLLTPLFHSEAARRLAMPLPF